ncbi:Non-specific lipid transfer protein GPI-anchored 5 [Linum perenne]
MACRKIALSLGIVFLTIQLWLGGAKAQSDCSTVVISLSPCLDYISSKSPNPSQQCCGQFETVVRSSPVCLCEFLNGGDSSFGVEVNHTRALELPTKCNVKTPPASRCNATSPTTAPLGGSQEPATPSTPGGNGSKPGTGTSNGSSVKASMSLLFFFFLFAASFCSMTIRY